jgi:hypothetical protein
MVSVAGSLGTAAAMVGIKNAADPAATIPMMTARRRAALRVDATIGGTPSSSVAYRVS